MKSKERELILILAILFYKTFLGLQKRRQKLVSILKITKYTLNPKNLTLHHKYYLCVELLPTCAKCKLEKLYKLEKVPL